MQHKVSNSSLTVSIESLGGELMSVKSGGIEFLWQGDPAYWAGHAYNLFPIVGRLKDGKYTFDGKTYEMNLHGFVRKSEMTVIRNSEESISFELGASDVTRAQYPFEFLYRVTYSLSGNRMNIAYHVENKGDKPMYFSVGGHPGFNVPIGGKGAFNNYMLEFSKAAPAKSIVLTPACLITDETKPFLLRSGRMLPLTHDLFDNDAIVLTDMAKSVTLKSSASPHSITLEYPAMKYLGIWHKPKTDAPYVCIEPWSALPAYDDHIDDLATKRDVTTLAPGGVYENKWNIEIK